MNLTEIFRELRETAYQDPLTQAAHVDQTKFFRQIDRIRSLGITVNK